MAGLALPATKSAQRTDMEVNAKRSVIVLMVRGVTMSLGSVSVLRGGPENNASKPAQMVPLERTAFSSVSAGTPEPVTMSQDTVLVPTAGRDWLVNKSALRGHTGTAACRTARVRMEGSATESLGPACAWLAGWENRVSTPVQREPSESSVRRNATATTAGPVTTLVAFVTATGAGGESTAINPASPAPTGITAHSSATALQEQRAIT